MFAVMVTWPDGDQRGLRELKKQITREAIADAARQLALGNGLDHVTRRDCTRAFVSRRAVGEKWLSKPVQAPLKQLGRLG